MLKRTVIVGILGSLLAVPALAQLRQVPGPAPSPPPVSRPQPPANPPPASAPTGAEDALYMGGFNGTWVGKLRVVDPAAVDSTVGAGTAGKEFEYAIVVSGTSAKTYFRKDGSWEEIKPGAFHVAAHKTNAIVYAIDSASDVYDSSGSGGWVETWNFTLTHKNSTMLYVAWTRSVNNYLKKPSEHGARFFIVAFGEMHQEPALP